MQLRGIATIPDYFTFRLSLTYGGVTSTTDPISGAAVASIDLEQAGSAFNGQGTCNQPARMSLQTRLPLLGAGHSVL